MANLHRKRRVARSDILWWACTFVGVQIAIALLLDSWLGICRDPDYVYRRWLIQYWQKAEPERPMVVVLGSSRSLFGLRPDVLEESRSGNPHDPFIFNFGISGAGVMHEHLKLKHLLRDGVRPDGLIVEFAPFTLGLNPEESKFIPVIQYDWKDLKELSHYRHESRTMYRDWLEARAVPCFSYRFQILSRFLPTWVPSTHWSYMFQWRGIDRKGWLETDRLRPLEESLAGEKKRQFGLTQQVEISDAHRRAMEDLLTTCKQESIPVVLMMMPESPTFRSWYSPQALANIDTYLADIRQRHGVLMIDARNWIDDETLYHEGNHLDRHGARVFTQRFAKEVTPHFANLPRGAIAAK